MEQYPMEKIQKKLKKYLDENRYEHTMGVQYTCAALAMRYGCDIEKARVAGLLHDCAKCIPDETKIEICKKNKIEIRTAEEKYPFLLHAKVGGYIAKKKYHVEDEEILGAILYHTTGRENMTMLEKITFIADYIEPHRNHAPNLTEIRKTAFEDLDEAMYRILADTMEYLDKKKMDSMTWQAYEYYKTQRESRDSRNVESDGRRKEIL